MVSQDTGREDDKVDFYTGYIFKTSLMCYLNKRRWNEMMIHS